MHLSLMSSYVQAGFTVRSFEWQNDEWDQDAHFEELWYRGEAGMDWDATCRVIEPDHFQGMFLIMGCFVTLWLIVLLWDMLNNPNFGFFKLMIPGLFACALFTAANSYFFSTTLWKPVFKDFGKGDIFMADYEFNVEKFVKHRTVALAILGYGALTSVIFIFIGLMRSIGKAQSTPFILDYKF